MKFNLFNLQTLLLSLKIVNWWFLLVLEDFNIDGRFFHFFNHFLQSLLKKEIMKWNKFKSEKKNIN